ncbi:MAG: zinc-binding dehydrogenase, partial [Deltaproteobacteria bacterium]|nr:zinc-binding dehydrogenase [Deltaproteobacteria bacterium]
PDAMDRLGHVDVVADAFGRGSLNHHRHALTRGGRYVSTVPTLRNTLDALATIVPRGGALRSRTTLCRASGRDLDTLAALADAGVLRTVVDGVFALDDVNAALARSRTFGVRGKLVLRV